MDGNGTFFQPLSDDGGEGPPRLVGRGSLHDRGRSCSYASTAVVRLIINRLSVHRKRGKTAPGRGRGCDCRDAGETAGDGSCRRVELSVESTATGADGGSGGRREIRETSFGSSSNDHFRTAAGALGDPTDAFPVEHRRDRILAR